jgi:hypothetical protein
MLLRKSAKKRCGLLEAARDLAKTEQQELVFHERQLQVRCDSVASESPGFLEVAAGECNISRHSGIAATVGDRDLGWRGGAALWHRDLRTTTRYLRFQWRTGGLRRWLGPSRHVGGPGNREWTGVRFAEVELNRERLAGAGVRIEPLP